MMNPALPSVLDKSLISPPATPEVLGMTGTHRDIISMKETITSAD